MVGYLFPPIGGWNTPANPWVPNTGVRSITLDGHIGKEMMFSAFVDNSVIGFRYRAQAPVGTLERPRWLVKQGKFLIYPAATIARSSLLGDIPSDTWVPDVLQQTLNFSRGLFSGADPRQLQSPGSGVIELDDLKGHMEYLLDYVWDTVPITMYRGNAKDQFSTWAIVGKFNGASIIATWDKKQIRLRDVGWRLAVSLHPNYYEGTGGVEGVEALKGQWKPYCVGYCYNIEPIQIDTENQIFQFNFVASQAVMALRHGGVNIAFHSNHATYAALVAAVVPTGYYATCLAESLVRVELEMDKSIRLDVQGDNLTQFGHGRPLTRGAIVRRIATCYGETNLDDASEIDPEAFNKLDQDHPATLGYYWTSQINADAAMTEVMSGILGWWYVKLGGVLSVGYARAPRANDAIAHVKWQEYNMSLIDMIDFATPRHATHIGWRRNYGPENRQSLAGSVDETTLTSLGQDTSWAIVDDDTVVELYPTSETVKIQGNFWNEDEALEEASRQQQLMGVERRRWRVNLDIDVFTPLMDQVIVLEGVNRLKLGSSKPLLVANVDTVGFGPAALDLWG